MFFIGNYTYEKKGTKRVLSTTSGAEKVNISAAFCCSADGIKLPVLILIPRKKPLKKFNPPANVVLAYTGSKSTFNQEVINEQFVDRVILPNMLRGKQGKALLYIDSAPCHKTKSVKKS